MENIEERSQFMKINDSVAKACGGKRNNLSEGRESTQLGWYKFIAETYCKGKTVLDVGAGLGEGLKILSETAKIARGIDADPRLQTLGIETKNVNEVPSKSVDIVTCIDVIEHIQNDFEFFEHLKRIAIELVVLTTPNCDRHSKKIHPYHVREYSEKEFRETFSPTEMLYGTGSGRQISKVFTNKKGMCGIFVV